MGTVLELAFAKLEPESIDAGGSPTPLHSPQCGFRAARRAIDVPLSPHSARGAGGSAEYRAGAWRRKGSLSRLGSVQRALWASVVVTLVPIPATADVTISAVGLPGGFSAVGAYSLASVIAQPTAAVTQIAGAAQLDPGFLCIEADDLGIPGDINNDGTVNSIDLAYLLADWGTSLLRSDFNHDGIVDAADLGTLLANWD